MKSGRGFFFTFEGIEGSGKTTIAQACVERLLFHRLDAVYVQDPGGCPISRSIRDILLYTDEKISPETELLLFAASRAQLVSGVIGPALASGKIVVCDRYIDSTVAYQGYGRGMNMRDIDVLNNLACKESWYESSRFPLAAETCRTHHEGNENILFSRELLPDVTFLLDLPVDTGLGRQKRIDRISSEHIEFHERVRKGFLESAAAHPNRITVIDASQSLDIVKDAVWKVMSNLIID